MQKIILRKNFLSWQTIFGKIIFGKIMGNVKKNRRIIKLVTTERRRDYLVSEPNYHTTKFFTENSLAIEMRKTQILMKKSVYLSLSILYLSKMNVWILLWLCKTKIWWKCKKPCYMDVDTQLHFSCKNRGYLQKHCRRYWNKVWHFRLLKKIKNNRINEKWIEQKNHERTF